MAKKITRVEDTMMQRIDYWLRNDGNPCLMVSFGLEYMTAVVVMPENEKWF